MTEKTLGRKPKDIPTVGNFSDNSDENTFKWLQEEYTNNDYDNDLVCALNTLNDDERNLMILFIVHKRKLAPLARYFHVSTPFLRKKLNEVRDKVMKAYEDILTVNEEHDYLLDKAKEPKPRQKRTVIQVERFRKKEINRYECVEDAAEAVGGKPECIKNVCNGHGFKYLNFRWFWEPEWNKIK